MRFLRLLFSVSVIAASAYILYVGWSSMTGPVQETGDGRALREEQRLASAKLETRVAQLEAELQERVAQWEAALADIRLRADEVRLSRTGDEDPAAGSLPTGEAASPAQEAAADVTRTANAGATASVPTVEHGATGVNVAGATAEASTPEAETSPEFMRPEQRRRELLSLAQRLELRSIGLVE
jgi:hypothetical protein